MNTPLRRAIVSGLLSPFVEPLTETTPFMLQTQRTRHLFSAPPYLQVVPSFRRKMRRFPGD